MGQPEKVLYSIEAMCTNYIDGKNISILKTPFLRHRCSVCLGKVYKQCTETLPLLRNRDKDHTIRRGSWI